LSRSEEDFFFFCLSEKGKEHYHGKIKAATLLCHMFPALIKLNKKKGGTPTSIVLLGVSNGENYSMEG
jgi:hypothetical protein